MFDAFERMMALRYLRARRKEGFVSVIAGFLAGRDRPGGGDADHRDGGHERLPQDLMSRILGFNGHLHVYGATDTLKDYDDPGRSGARR